MSEKWRPIPGFDGHYDASDMGRVRSYWGGRGSATHLASTPQRILRSAPNSRGYHQVVLSANGKKYVRKVATLVMLAFEGERPPDAMVCHCDNDLTNDCLTNLRYDSMVGNMKDLTAESRIARAGRKLSDKEVREIRQRYANGGWTQAALACEYSVGATVISNLCRGVTYRASFAPEALLAQRRARRR